MAWYKDWFNEEYLKLYSHRDQREAAQHVQFLQICGLLNPGITVLDIACGAGRHLIELEKRGFSTIGIDLSQSLLNEAKLQLSKESLPANLYHADMRSLPVANASQDLVLSMFTSFGYFDSDDEHIQLLQEWNRVLSPKGRLVIDYMNKPFVLKNTKKKSKKQIDNYNVSQNRHFSEDGKRVFKHIEFKNIANDSIKEYFESVRLYDLEEMDELLFAAGLTRIAVYGDFDANDYNRNSARLIIIAQSCKNVV